MGNQKTASSREWEVVFVKNCHSALFREILLGSDERFGSAAADRYAALIRQALLDVQENPTRPGARPRPDLAPDAFVYHLAFSRDRVSGQRGKSPRHFVLYRFRAEVVEFARLPHDSYDLARHLPSEYAEEEGM